MERTELITKIRNADLGELNKMALEYGTLAALQCKKGKASADVDYGEIVIELCARKQELTESKEVGEAYRERMLARHFATADEFLDLSVEDGILSAEDAADIRENQEQALQRLYTLEEKVSLEWLIKYGSKIRKEK